MLLLIHRKTQKHEDGGYEKMTQKQIVHNTEGAKKYSEDNNCTVYCMCSPWFNNDYEGDRELIGTYNEITKEALELNGFWEAFRFVNGVRR